MSTSVQSTRTGSRAVLATLLLLIGLNLLNYIDRYILPGAQPLIQQEFGWTDQQMGALTTAFFVVYMLVAPLTGWLGDRFPRKPLIIGGAVLWSLATLATAWVHDYWTLYVRHALVGVGEATFGIFAPAVLADFYPERDRNRILSIFYLAIPVGAALGYLAGGQLGSRVGLAGAVLSVRDSGARDCGAVRLAGPRTGARVERSRRADGEARHRGRECSAIRHF